MSNVALVQAARGFQHQVTNLHEETLEEAYTLLEHLHQLAKEASAVGLPRPSGPRRVLTLPGNLQDWYVPRGVDRPQWHVQSDEDERQLHKHVAALHKLGIPTFLREQSPPLVRFFVSLEAHVREALLPDEGLAQAAFWASLHQGLAGHVATAMAETALQLFGAKHSSNLVAVFAASGFSAASNRWKVSLRINFVELSVTQDTARKARDLLVERLDGEWESMPREGWSAALEAIDRGTAAGAGTGPGGATLQAAAPAAGSQRSFWDRVVDARALQRGAQHRLVWCDTAQGDPLLPEERPLAPHSLLHVVTSPDGPAELKRARVADDLADGDWTRLGSVWASSATASEFWNARSRPQTRSAPLLTPIPHSSGDVGREVPADVWFEYRTPDGRSYFHQPLSGNTVWVLPPGAVLASGGNSAAANASTSTEKVEPQQWRAYRSLGGQAYYHNAATGESVWELPEGSVLAGSSTAPPPGVC